MLDSTKAYLDKLIQGDYLQFLQWPAYLEKQYKNKYVLTANTMLNLLVFELINNNFNDKHVTKLVVLTKLVDSYPNYLTGKLHWFYVQIYGAFLQCMVINANELSKYYISTEEMTNLEFDFLMNTNFYRLDPNSYNTSTENQTKLYSEKVKTVAAEAVNALYKLIFPIIDMRNQANTYIAVLRGAQNHSELAPDQLKLTRLSLVSALVDYLDGLIELSPAAEQVIANYVKGIQEAQPHASEQQYLSYFLSKLKTVSAQESELVQVQEPTMSEEIISAIGSWAVRFFYDEPPQDKPVVNITIKNNS